MTGYDIFKQVCSLLGYDSLTENSNNGNGIVFCHILNQIAEDLEIPSAESLSETVNVTKKQKEALIYGCAMLFAGSKNDTALANTFTNLYNSKRTGVLCKKDTRQDVLPYVNGGGG